VLVVLAVVAQSGAARGAGALEVRISPRVAHAPATILIVVEIEPESSNRYAVIEADGERFSRSSTIPLEGGDSPRTHDVQYRGLPAGHYVIGVTLVGPSGVRAVERRDVIVRDGGDRSSR
jgi:hypothetical protein